jgi:outer membrane protein TolC
MIKKICQGMLFFTIVNLELFAQSYGYTKYDVNIREYPSIDSHVVKEVQKDTKITVKEMISTDDSDLKNWFKVEGGYVYSELVYFKNNGVDLSQYTTPSANDVANYTKVEQVAHTPVVEVEEKGKEVKPLLENSVTKQIEIEKNENEVDIALSKLISQVIQRNATSIQTYIDTQIAEHSVDYEKNIYDPILNISLAKNKTHIPNSTADQLTRIREEYKEETKNFDLSVNQLFSSGAQLTFSTSLNSKQSSIIEDYRAYDTEYDSNIKLDLKQPLLKNFGSDATELKINLAKIEEKSKKATYEQQLMELALKTTQLYWRLYGSNEIVKSWNKSIELSTKTLEDIELLIQNGKIAKTEFHRAKSYINIRKTEQESASNSLSEVKSQIYNLLNISYIKNKHYEIKTQSLELGDELKYDLDTYVAKALEKWPKYQTLLKKLEQEKLNVDYYDNQLKPQLDLVANVTSTELTSESSKKYSDLDDDDFISWKVGLNFQTPIMGNKKDKNNYKIAKLNYNKIKVELDTLIVGLENSLGSKINAIESYKKQYYFAKNSFDLKKELLNIEYEKLKRGKSDTQKIFNIEEEYMDSQRKYLSSLINLKTSQAILDMALGDILTKNNIELESIKPTLTNHNEKLIEMF